jgi:hypothetical protein
MTFGVWLRRQPATNADAQALQTFSESLSLVEWPYHLDDLAAYHEAIDKHAQKPDRSRLLNALGKAYRQWLAEREGRSTGFWKGALETVRSRPGRTLLSIFGLFVAIILLVGLFFFDFLDKMSDPSQARGLITFMFSFSTISIVVLVVVALFWLEYSEFKERFDYAKDVITILIGVLGTILGFYFGSLAHEPNNQATQENTAQQLKQAIENSQALPRSAEKN